MSPFPLPPSIPSLLSSKERSLQSSIAALPYLIVVPKSVIHQWESEWNRFIDSSSFRWIRIDSMDELNDKYPILQQCSTDTETQACPTTIITTYPVIVGAWRVHQASNGSESLPRRFLFDMLYSCILADEAHRCRNLKTDEAQAMLELSGRAPTRVFISATAITNSVQDLVSMFTVMRHPAIEKEESAPVWTTVTDKLKEAEAARRKYRAAVLPTLGPADWYRHVEMPSDDTTETNLNAYQTVSAPTNDPDLIYTQSHFQDLLDQRNHARRKKKAKLSIEQDKADLVAKSKAYRQTYENLDAVALATVMSQLGASIIRRSRTSMTYKDTAFDTSGFSIHPLQVDDVDSVLEVFEIQRRIYKVIPGMEERKIVTDLLVANSATSVLGEENDQKDELDREDQENEGNANRAMNISQSTSKGDAFHTLGRLAALFLGSAQWPGTPVQLLEGALRILCSAKLSTMARLCVDIVTSDSAKPAEEQRKIGIFVRWTSGFPIIQYHLLEAGLGSVTLSGEDSAQERDSIVQSVQQPGPDRVKYSDQLSRALADDPRTKTNRNILNSHILILSEAGVKASTSPESRSLSFWMECGLQPMLISWKGGSLVAVI